MSKLKVQIKFKKEKIKNQIISDYYGFPLNFELGILALFCHLDFDIWI